MTEAERARLTLEHYDEHQAEWDAYLNQPIAVRQAVQQKIDATYHAEGIQAARDMMRALGMPVPPEGLWAAMAELEVKQAMGEDVTGWLREVAGQLGMSEDEINDVLAPEQIGRVDH